MYIIFEDNKDSPVSNLLRNCFWGENLVFASGVGNIMSTIVDLINKGAKRMIVYIDVVPDNTLTIDAFIDIRDIIDTMYGSLNIEIVPIPCIEYYVLQLLIERQYISKEMQGKIGDIMLNSFNYEAILSLTSDNTRSLEARYKSILANCGRCYRNKLGTSQILDNNFVGVDGKFYYEDCGNCGYYCKSGASDKLSVKADLLYTSLPLFYYFKSKHSKRLNELSVTTNDNYGSGLKVVKSFYYNLCSDMENTLRNRGVIVDFTNYIDGIFID